VIYRLGSGPGRAPAWKPRITIPTLASFQPFRDFAARFRLDIEAWLYSDRACGPLEACAGRWRPAVQNLAFDPGCGDVPSVAQSAPSRRQPLTASSDRWNGPTGPAASTRLTG
jgi:hypothetical protein